MKYACLRDPKSLVNTQSLLAIPFKRTENRLTSYLSREEINAILDAPDPSTWSGQRDRVMFAVFYNTGQGYRKSVGSVCVTSILTVPGASRFMERAERRGAFLCGKLPVQIRQWLDRLKSSSDAPLFPNRRGEPMSRSGMEDRLARAVAVARLTCSSLAERVISPHSLRHSTAMHLLQAGISESVIALWLGHESVTTTHRYVEADLTMKKRALSHLQEPQASRFATNLPEAC